MNCGTGNNQDSIPSRINNFGVSGTNLIDLRTGNALFLKGIEKLIAFMTIGLLLLFFIIIIEKIKNQKSK